MINLVIGIAITSILNGVARSAYRVRQPPSGGRAGQTEAPGMPPPPWQST